MHGVSTVVVIILILMISVALSALSYMFFSKVYSSVTTTAKEAITQSTTSTTTLMKIDSVSVNTVYIRNMGRVDLSNFSVYVGDRLATNFSVTPTVIKSGEVGTVIIYDFISKDDDIKITTAQGALSTKKISDPCNQAILCSNFDEGSGTKAYDSSPYNNYGTLSGTFVGDFEGSLDGFASDCSPLSSSYVTGRIGNGLKIWSTSGTACIAKPLSSVKPINYTIWFYGKGYVMGGIYNTTTFVSYVEDAATGCRTPNGGIYMYTSCNSNQPYNDWRLFKFVSYVTSLITPKVVLYSAGTGESYAGYYDFTTDGPIWLDGQYDSTLSFDGFDDYVSLPLPTFTEPYTISLWFYPRELNREQILFYLGGGAYSFPRVELTVSNRLLIYAGSEKYRYGKRIFTSSDLNKWWYVNFIVVNPSDLTTWKIYLNGIDDSDAVGANTGTYYSPSTSGTIASVSGSIPFNGIIDEARIYNKAIY